MGETLIAATFLIAGVMVGVSWANRPTRPNAKCPWPMCGFKSLPNDRPAKHGMVEECPACSNLIMHNDFTGYSRAAPLKFEA